MITQDGTSGRYINVGLGTQIITKYPFMVAYQIRLNAANQWHGIATQSYGDGSTSINLEITSGSRPSIAIAGTSTSTGPILNTGIWYTVIIMQRAYNVEAFYIWRHDLNTFQNSASSNAYVTTIPAVPSANKSIVAAWQDSSGNQGDVGRFDMNWFGIWEGYDFTQGQNTASQVNSLPADLQMLVNYGVYGLLQDRGCKIAYDFNQGYTELTGLWPKSTVTGTPIFSASTGILGFNPLVKNIPNAMGQLAVNSNRRKYRTTTKPPATLVFYMRPR